MKFLLLFSAFWFQVSAAALGQQVTMTYKDAMLKDVMTAVRKQTGYYFFYETRYLDNARPVTVNLKNTPIETALHSIFKDQPFEFNIDGKMITVQPKKQSILQKVTDLFTLLDIRGKVVDEQGNPLPGASVKAGGKVAVTNADGEFSLTGIDENTMVEVSYIGFQLTKIKAKPDFMTIALQTAAADLKEVTINKGYYKTDNILNTGTVATVSAKEIERQPVSDPILTLQGRIPGLNIFQNSGVSGSKLNISLRGQNSLRTLAGANLPLFIIDGVPFNGQSMSQYGDASGGLSPFSSFRPDDIENIEVLKDADATAIYGSRGANGVILISTKKGRSGKSSVNFNFYQGAGEVTNRLPLMNTEQYLSMRMEGVKNDNLIDIPDTDHDINGVWSKTAYTNWQDLLIGGTSHTTDAKVSMTGGNDFTTFLVSGAFRRETTVFPGDYANRIGSLHFNLDNTSESKKFKINLSANYTINENKLPITDMTNSIFLAPNSPDLYDALGNLNWAVSTWTNPLAPTKNRSNNQTKNLLGNLILSYEMISGLTAKTSLGYNTIALNENLINTYAGVDPTNDPASSRSNSFASNQVNNWIVEPQLNFSKKFGLHSLDVLMGGTLQEQSSYRQSNFVSGFSSDELIENISGATNKGNPIATFREYKYNAVFGRIGYNYDRRYVLNLTGRRDGSSRFGPGKQFGNFGAIAAAWVLSNEDFWRNSLRFLSLAKLRGSIGVTGNDQIPDYQFLSTYTPNVSYLGLSTLRPTQLTNPNYRWEKIRKIEAGVEFGVLNNKILLNIDYYRNRTANQLVQYALPSVAGFTAITANLPAVIENKGWEFQLNTVNIENANFSWSSSVNLTFARNKLVSYPNFESSTYRSQYAIGMPLTIKYRFHYAGIDPNTGLYTFEDRDKDGQITYSNDRIPVNVAPKYFGGISNSLRYKSFSLDFLLQFVKQNGIEFHTGVTPGFLKQNEPTWVLDRWTQPGQAAKYQRFAAAGGSNAHVPYEQFLESDGVINDASFIRLKNLSFSWTLPEKLKINAIRSLRLFVQGQNLLTISDFKGIDPETNGLGALFLPPLRTLTVGLNISL
jgi:TonB-linked SusC/RagA family outer membrane protein